MSDWIKATVGQITKYQRAGGTPTVTNDQYYNGEIPFVTIEDITNSFRYLNQTKRHLSYKGLKNSAAWLLTEPHILYSMYATVGKPIINKVSCATNQAIIALEASDEIDQLYLYYQLLYIRPQVYKYTSQTTQSNLNAALVKKLVISYPKNKSTQKKIANILTSIDNAIEKTEALIHKYQQIKAGLMHDLFTRGVTADGKLRPPREKAPELYKETPIGWIPKEWECSPVKELCSQIVDCPHSTPEYQDHGIPCIRTADMKPGELLIDQAYCVNEKSYFDRIGRLIPQCGDIIYSREGERLGIASPVGKQKVCLGQRVMLLRPSQETDSDFLLWSLNMPGFFTQVIKGLGATTSPHINVGDIKMILTPKPKRKEQTVIGDFLRQAHKKIQAEEVYTKKLFSKKMGLMQDLLTGKVRVKAANQEEPVHV